MSVILSYLASIRLSVVQWGLLTLSVVVGGLVGALRVQGGRLHAAQIQLLVATIRQSDTDKETAVIRAKEQLTTALREYYGRTK